MALRKATSTTDGDLLLLVNSTDGSLTTYSILRGQNVIAPSLSTTDGEFVNVGVDVDQIYFTIKRTISSAAKYYVSVLMMTIQLIVQNYYLAAVNQVQLL